MFGFDKIPDNTNKIYVVLCIVAFYFIGTAVINETQKQEIQYELLTSKVDDGRNTMIELSEKHIKLLKMTEYISLKYNIENLVSFTDSTAFLNLKNDTSKSYLTAVEIILPIYLDYIASYNKQRIENLKFNGAIESQRKSFSTIQGKIVNYGILAIMVLIVFFSSIKSMRKRESELELVEKYNLREKGKLAGYCQSCGRNFDSIVCVSKNLDNSYNYSFCSECLSNGVFIKNYDDVKELVNSNETISENEKQNYISFLNNLDRWKKNRYPNIKLK